MLPRRLQAREPNTSVGRRMGIFAVLFTHVTLLMAVVQTPVVHTFVTGWAAATDADWAVHLPCSQTDQDPKLPPCHSSAVSLPAHRCPFISTPPCIAMFGSTASATCDALNAVCRPPAGDYLSLWPSAGVDPEPPCQKARQRPWRRPAPRWRLQAAMTNPSMALLPALRPMQVRDQEDLWLPKLAQRGHLHLPRPSQWHHPRLLELSLQLQCQLAREPRRLLPRCRSSQRRLPRPQPCQVQVPPTYHMFSSRSRTTLTITWRSLCVQIPGTGRREMLSEMPGHRTLDSHSTMLKESTLGYFLMQTTPAHSIHWCSCITDPSSRSGPLHVMAFATDHHVPTVRYLVCRPDSGCNCIPRGPKTSPWCCARPRPG